MESDLELARRAALDGAAVALRYFAAFAGLRHEVKPDGTVVTEADRTVEAAIRRVLAEARPDDAIVGEEGGQTGEGSRRWIIDPIDGTAPFVAGRDRWQVLVALEEAGEIVVGVAAVPAQGKIWWAERGGGAFEADIADMANPAVATAASASAAPVGGSASSVTASDSASPITNSAQPTSDWAAAVGGSVITNARRITVSRDRLDVLAGSRFGVIPDDRLTAAERERIAPLSAVATAVPWDTHAALLVANGRLDLAVQVRGQIWDFAATSLIVTEAGGYYGGLDGQTRPAPGLALFARSAVLHTAALPLLRT